MQQHQQKNLSSANSSASSLSVQTHASKLSITTAPRTPSPVSPLAQLMSLGFLPGDTQSPNSPSLTDKSLRGDIMELEHIKARCIRVKGVNSQSHIIDVSDLNDAKV
jgi:hypothetical protein